MAIHRRPIIAPGARPSRIRESESAGQLLVQEKLPERFLAREMIEAAPARCSFLEIKLRDGDVIVIRDRQQAGLLRLDDRLINGDDVEIGQAPAELESIVRRARQFLRLKETARQFLGEKIEKRRHP